VLRNDVDEDAGRPCDTPDPGWCWPPYATWETVDDVFGTDEWAPPSSVRRPWVRLGRWTLLYRRAA
jgi:hypothetical protein